GKRKESRYLSGKRSDSWLKVKPATTADFVIGGYTQGKGARAPLGSILVGTWDHTKLKFASHVGSGFDERGVDRMKDDLAKLKRKTCPFDETPELHSATTWVEPKVVAEVKFHSWTEDNRLRAPVFVKVRDDIDAKKVKRGTSHSRVGGNPGELDPRPHGDDIGKILAQLDQKKPAITLAVGPHQIKLTNL